jgi:phosphatidylinositol 4-kinase
MIHIDFSYILGEDPQHTSAEMKITQDMLDMLGGKTSLSFTIFKNRCKKAFSKIRRRSSLWYIILSYLAFITPEIPNFNENFSLIKHHVLERLVPGENDKEASMQIINIVDRSSNALHISDWTHNISVRLSNLKDSIFNFELT